VQLGYELVTQKAANVQPPLAATAGFGKQHE